MGRTKDCCRPSTGLIDPRSDSSSSESELEDKLYLAPGGRRIRYQQKHCRDDDSSEECCNDDGDSDWTREKKSGKCCDDSSSSIPEMRTIPNRGHCFKKEPRCGGEVQPVCAPKDSCDSSCSSSSLEMSLPDREYHGYYAKGSKKGSKGGCNEAGTMESAAPCAPACEPKRKYKEYEIVFHPMEVPCPKPVCAMPQPVCAMPQTGCCGQARQMTCPRPNACVAPKMTVCPPVSCAPKQASKCPEDGLYNRVIAFRDGKGKIHKHPVLRLHRGQWYRFKIAPTCPPNMYQDAFYLAKCDSGPMNKLPNSFEPLKEGCVDFKPDNCTPDILFYRSTQTGIKGGYIIVDNGKRR